MRLPLFYIMKFLTILVISAGLLTASQAMEKPSFHTKGTPIGKPTGTLKPGEYWWSPQLSPTGPVVVLVSIPQQTMHVYRNGILIGRSTVSTGTKSHSTPGGVFSILEKKQTHRSKKYNNAPMPYMQRLTWSGIAMHSGALPGYPASHGCIRLPYDFSQLLFKATASGGTVVVGDGKTPTPHLASNPGLLLAPKDFSPEMVRRLAKDEYDWKPERSTEGPITIVVSSADRCAVRLSQWQPDRTRGGPNQRSRWSRQPGLHVTRRQHWQTESTRARTRSAQMDACDQPGPAC